MAIEPIKGFYVHDEVTDTDGVAKVSIEAVHEFVEDVSGAVENWLDQHPEATTTVQDGAITKVKLDNSLQSKTMRIITTYSEFVDAMQDGNKNTSYVCGNIEITAPITLTDRTQAAFKSFSNAVFVLNSDMFKWSPIGNYYNIPNFTDCTFIGNGHNIAADGAYVLNGKFVNCNFIDCGIVENGAFAQSQHFVNCRFANPAGHDFIHSKIVYETRFVACQAESDNKAKIVNAFDTTANSTTTSQILFIGGIYEAQTDNIVCMHDGQACFVSVYTEAISAPSIKVLPTNRTANGILKIDIQDCKINPASGVYFTDIDASFEGSVLASFTCRNSTVAQGKLVNTNNLWYFKIENVDVNSNGSILPSYESSKVYPVKNSIVDFSAQTGHVIVKKFPCLITFDSSDGGWHTNLYFVSLSYGNRPQVQCLSDPTKTPTITYDDETGFCDVTLHAARGVNGNSSAVLLTGLENNLTGNNYWIPNGGYNA